MRLLNLIFPPRCVLCGEPLALIERYDVPCAECLKTLPVLKEPMGGDVPGVMCLAPLKYDKQVRGGLRGMKFRRRTAGVKFFARLMVQCLVRYGLTAVDTVTWVPVSAARERSRGYDQSELLARAVAKAIRAKPRRLIYKVRNTRPNSVLKKEAERRENVAGAFKPMPFARINGTVLLVDDIITTGSTAGECAELLRSGGAERVIVLAAARAR